MNPSSLFQEANQFILPQTKLFDFFDYLAGQKLQIEQDKPLSEKLKITFRHIDTIPKKLYHNRKFDSKDSQFKPIFLRQIHDQLKQDHYPTQEPSRFDSKNKQLAHSNQKYMNSSSKINFNLNAQRKKPAFNSLSTNRGQSNPKNYTQNTTNI